VFNVQDMSQLASSLQTSLSIPSGNLPSHQSLREARVIRLLSLSFHLSLRAVADILHLPVLLL